MSKTSSRLVLPLYLFLPPSSNVNMLRLPEHYVPVSNGEFYMHMVGPRMVGAVGENHQIIAPILTATVIVAKYGSTSLMLSHDVREVRVLWLIIHKNYTFRDHIQGLCAEASTVYKGSGTSRESVFVPKPADRQALQLVHRCHRAYYIVRGQFMGRLHIQEISRAATEFGLRYKS